VKAKKSGGSMDSKNRPRAGYVFIETVSGPEGLCLCIGDDNGGYRLAGPKPWGGGTVVKRFSVNIKELEKQLKLYRRKAKSAGGSA
jgi:hypothetical protein